MKIRNGFVSNSSSSSFIIIMLPDNFDPEVYIDYMNEKQKKNKKKTYGSNVTSNLRDLIKRGVVYEYDNNSDNYYDLFDAVYGLKIFDGETAEGSGYIELVNKKIFDKINKIKIDFDMDKMKAATIEIRENREKMKMKYKHIDPYGEEDWEEDDKEDVKEGIVVKDYEKWKKNINI